MIFSNHLASLNINFGPVAFRSQLIHVWAILIKHALLESWIELRPEGQSANSRVIVAFSLPFQSISYMEYWHHYSRISISISIASHRIEIRHLLSPMYGELSAMVGVILGRYHQHQHRNLHPLASI